MPGVSKKTKAMMVRLPVDLASRVEKNARSRGVGVSEYLRSLVMRQIGRKR